jgi:hypothetical protein
MRVLISLTAPTIEHAPTSCLWCCLDTVGVGWICLDRGPTAGVTVPNRYGSAAIGASGSPYPRAPRHGHRPFSIGLVNSSRGSFVWQLHLYSRLNFKLNRAAALAEWRQLLSA